MRKKVLSLSIIFTLVITALMGCSDSKTNLEDSSGVNSSKLVLNEVAHSVFYAPMYVAIEKNYFTEEGLDLILVTGFGADKTMTAVLSGEADIGFMGSEASIV